MVRKLKHVDTKKGQHEMIIETLAIGLGTVWRYVVEAESSRFHMTAQEHRTRTGSWLMGRRKKGYCSLECCEAVTSVGSRNLQMTAQRQTAGLGVAHTD